MKKSSAWKLLVVTLLVLGLEAVTVTGSAGPLMRRQPAPPAKPAQPKPADKQPAENVQPEITLLRQAYMTLFVADHDYHGHRIRAMHHTAQAASILGVTFGGDGRAGENQGVSDNQLHQAKALLEQAQAQLAAKHRPRAVQCVAAAIREINIALKIA